MWKISTFLAICLVTVEALPRSGRIVGGTTAPISRFPFATVLLISENNAPFRQDCGGCIINNRSILSAAHCWAMRPGPMGQFRIRIGSTYANSGGVVHHVQRHITHPDYFFDWRNIRSDIGIVRVASALSLGGNARAAPIAGPNFHINDNTAVWALGWGILQSGGRLSESLQHVQLNIINHGRCQSAFNPQNVNAGTICAGWHANGRGACSGDSGGPLVHNGVAIGVFSFSGTTCGDARWPSVYARVSTYNRWILSNA